MPNLEERIEAFSELGEQLQKGREDIDTAISKAEQENPWFLREFIEYNLDYWSAVLKKPLLQEWLSTYSIPDTQRKPLWVGLVFAGNIPLVGMHDLICVLMSGHKALIKLSSKDRVLPKCFIDLLLDIHPPFKERIKICDHKLGSFDAIIATGSTNTARYFEYYFAKYPHIIRKNKNSIAVIKGDESPEILEEMADDVFLYFGLGCRSVSKIMLPENYDPKKLFPGFEKYAYFSNMHKYMNNYEYRRSVFLLNQEAHFDNGFLLLKQAEQLASPISVLYYDYYKNFRILTKYLHEISEDVQIVSGLEEEIHDNVKHGDTQKPALSDYADGIDTMKFLLSL